MTFTGSVHSFYVIPKKIDGGHFFASKTNRREIIQAIKKQLKWEIGNDSIGDEENKTSVAHMQIDRSNFLSDIQEYASFLEQKNIDNIYTGQEQSRFNHLIEIHNNIAIYLPVYFFFPMHISIKQNPLPIFIGSSVKLYRELKQIDKELQAKSNTALEDITPNMHITEEDLEDHESSHEGVDNFWPCFNYIVLGMLTKKSIKEKLPLFIF